MQSASLGPLDAREREHARRLREIVERTRETAHAYAWERRRERSRERLRSRLSGATRRVERKGRPTE